jgi:hypothetical protein
LGGATAKIDSQKPDEISSKRAGILAIGRCPALLQVKSKIPIHRMNSEVAHVDDERLKVISMILKQELYDGCQR